MDEKLTEQENWERSPGYVYFIAAGDPPLAIKIGITKKDKLKDRIRELQSSNHEFLRFLGVVPFLDSKRPMKDAQAHEKELHKKFKEFRRREGAGSEWFTADTEILDYIEKNASPIPESDDSASQDQASNASSVRFSDYDEFWSKFQNDKNIADVKSAKSLHDALVFPGYITELKGTLQFRLIDSSENIVMAIYINGGMEIYFNHPNKLIIESHIKKHVKLDKVQSYSSEKQYLFLGWNDWKGHINELKTAFEQINKAYRRNQEVEIAKMDIV